MTPITRWARPQILALTGGLWLAPLCLAAEAEAEVDSGFALVGARVGISENPQIRHAEAFADWQFPRTYSLGRGFQFKPCLSGSVGWIGDDANDAALVSLGPSFRFSYEGLPLAFVGGSAPTLVGRNHFADRDLGCALQFTSHLGLAWQFARHAELCYRFQHMSNAGLGADNPGLNSHVVSLGWRF